MTGDLLGREGDRARHREWATAIVLAGLVGSVVDWLIVLSQFTQRGDISPFLPPFALVTLAIGVVVSCPAIALTSQVRFRSAAAAGVAIAGLILLTLLAAAIGGAFQSADILFTLIWFTPIALVAIPVTTWVASRTGHVWRGSAIALLASVDLGTMLMMWFGLPRV